VHKVASGPEFIRRYTAYQQVAFGYGIPFGVIHNAWPFAHGTAAAAAAARNWLGRFTGLDGGCRWLCYFDYGPWSLKRNAGALVPAYRSLHHRLQAR
jgi:hypothetical protein